MKSEDVKKLRLCVITNSIEIARHALKGGAGAIQYREEKGKGHDRPR